MIALITTFSQWIIPVFVLFIVGYGMLKKVKVYDCAVAGAKDSFEVILRIFPYLVAILFAVKVFQASGALAVLTQFLAPVLTPLGISPEAIGLMVVKPMSGSAATGFFTDIVKTSGPDSFTSRVCAVINGSAETTFYVLAVYLGAVGIKKTRYLVPVCLIADVIGIVVAIAVVRWMF